MVFFEAQCFSNAEELDLWKNIPIGGMTGVKLHALPYRMALINSL
jgi:hypothetical protein